MIKDILQEAFVLKSKGYYKHAIEAFYKALVLDDSSTELFLEIAELYYKLGNDERALNYIEQLLTKDPSHIEALKLLMNIFTDKKAWQEAEKTAVNIYQISQKTDDLLKILELLNKQKDYQRVLNYNITDSDSNILYELAYAALFSNEIDLAENHINKALEIANSSKLLLLKAKILFKKNRTEECTELINQIPFDEDNADYLNFSGIVNQYNFSYSEALNLFKKAIKIDPSNDEYYYNCASTYFKMGEISYAKKYYNLAISLNPDNPNYHFALANLYYAEKQYKRAFEELNYNFFEANLLKAIILYDTGYIAIARKILIELEQERPNDSILIEYKKRIEEDLAI